MTYTVTIEFEARSEPQAIEAYQMMRETFCNTNMTERFSALTRSDNGMRTTTIVDLHSIAAPGAIR